MSYTATTSSATNKVTATAKHPKAVILITVNGAPHVNDTSTTWLPGANTVIVTVTRGTTKRTYTVIVTKTGGIGSLTVQSAAGTETGDTEISITGGALPGGSFVYRTDTSVDLPTVDDDVSDWDPWDGEADITATNGHDIVIAQMFDGKAKATGKATVVANTG